MVIQCLEFELSRFQQGEMHEGINVVCLQPVCNYNLTNFAEEGRPSMGLGRMLWCQFLITNNDG